MQLPPQLQSGQGTIRQNVASLMTAPRSASRVKAIATIAKKNNISRKDAQFRQAIRISQRLARKS